jgi:putative endonuclease
VSRSDVGRAGEEAAVRHLLASGYRIVARNVRYRLGEIDVVAQDGGCLVFVEVKTRSSTGFGTAAEAVTARKRQRLVQLASLYLAGHGGMDRPCRFDVVAVEPGPGSDWACTVIRDAFGA